MVCIAFRQSIRSGLNAGKLIEDYGIASDVVIRPTVEDVIEQSSGSQWKRISTHLATLAIVLPHVHFTASPENLVDVVVGAGVSFNVSTVGLTKCFLVYQQQVITRVSLVEKVINMVLSGSPPISIPGLHVFKLTAASSSRAEEVITYRFLRFIPSVRASLTAEDDTVSIQQPLPSVAVFNTQPSAGDGWMGMKVGNGTQYAPNINSKLSMFLDPAPHASLQITGIFDTEKDFDFLTIGYTDALGTVPLAKVSGNGTFDQKSFSFSPKGPFEVFLLFTSDSNQSGKGVTISAATISRSG